MSIRSAAGVMAAMIWLSLLIGPNDSHGDQISGVDPQQSTLVLGWEIPRPIISAVAHQDHTLGIGALDADDAETAASILEQVVTDFPHFDVARRDLIRALVATGRYGLASEHTRVLLASDLPGHWIPLLEDPALQVWRDQDAGLLKWISIVYQKWSNTVTTAWPMLLYRDMPMPETMDPPEFYTSPWVRAGGFDPKSGRFLPLGTAVDDSAAVWFEPSSQRMLLIRFHGTVDLFSEVMDLAWRMETWLPDLENPDPVKWTVWDEFESYGVADFWIGADGAKSRFVELDSPFASTIGAPGGGLRVLAEGTLLLGTPSGELVIDGNCLEIPGQGFVTLGEGHAEALHHSLVRAEQSLYIVSNEHGCNWNDPDLPAQPVAQHVIDRINLETGLVERLSEGSGAASLVVLSEGTVLFQRGVRVDAFMASDERWKEPMSLPSGLVLHVPLRAKVCNYD